MRERINWIELRGGKGNYLCIYGVWSELGWYVHKRGERMGTRSVGIAAEGASWVSQLVG
jgi:hypothetical protein